MYLKRLQIRNYGPIRELDVSFPFDDQRPKPVLLVGENGSGKTIALSHIANAMVLAKDMIYPESGELDLGKVFKLRSNSYVSVGAEHYYVRSDFESGLFARELRLTKPRSEYSEPPMGTDGPGLDAWEAQFDEDGVDHFETNVSKRSMTAAVRELVSARCLLYFPSDRAEEPAWLNQANLRAKPQYTDGIRREGETGRRLIAHAPLRDIHDWLYDVAYDRAAFEMQTRPITFPVSSSSDKTQSQSVSFPKPLFLGYQGDATNAYDVALDILRNIVPELSEMPNLRFGIGRRHNRVISLESDQGAVVPNLFQLSSGEMALLALFLSILRDFDLRESRDVPFASAQDIKGLVVVDEVDLHLHARHQYDVLPNLLRMFPQIQFVMTTHSPLFVLGMAKVFGEDGFEIYDLPSGSRIAPENFDEFGSAFLAFKSTGEFAEEIKAQVAAAAGPILFVEGGTDRDYLQRAAQLLEKKSILGKFKVIPAGGEGKLKTIWNNLPGFPEISSRPVVLLHDPEGPSADKDKGRVHKRKMQRFAEHPIPKGIEHLFSRETMAKAARHKSAFVDIITAHKSRQRGNEEEIPESWSVNSNEKRSLCDWLCAEGTREDFQHFEHIFEILDQIDTSLETGSP